MIAVVGVAPGEILVVYMMPDRLIITTVAGTGQKRALVVAAILVTVGMVDHAAEVEVVTRSTHRSGMVAITQLSKLVFF